MTSRKSDYEIVWWSGKRRYVSSKKDSFLNGKKWHARNENDSGKSSNFGATVIIFCGLW